MGNKEGIKYMTKQKIALVCDWLTGVGGAEKVILAVHKMYPDAPIYTSQYRPKTIDWFKSADVRTGWLNYVPAGLKRFIPFLRQFYFSTKNVIVNTVEQEVLGIISQNSFEKV